MHKFIIPACGDFDILNTSKKEDVEMTKDNATRISPEDEALVKKLNEDYVTGVTILKRIKPPGPTRPKRVTVYIDGLLTTMPEDILDSLIENRFVIVVATDWMR
jgi:hypothetical protein